MFYNCKRKHGSNNLLSPIEYENRYQERLVTFPRNYYQSRDEIFQLIGGPSLYQQQKFVYCAQNQLKVQVD
jgi:hypothetical protein